MPYVEIEIPRAWRHRGEPTRIHYIRNEDGAERHRYVDEGDPLYAVLDRELRAQGYTGPRSAEPTPMPCVVDDLHDPGDVIEYPLLVPMTCANCDGRADGVIEDESDYIVRIECQTCGYVEERG